jgi:hypothetical protein
MRKRIPEKSKPVQTPFREMMMITERYEGSVRSSLHVLHTMCRIALCLEEYSMMSLSMAEAMCNLVRNLPHSELHFDLVQRQVEAEISRPMNTRLPSGFVYKEDTFNRNIVLYKFITPPDIRSKYILSGISFHRPSLCVWVIYAASGFKSRVSQGSGTSAHNRSLWACETRAASKAPRCTSQQAICL